MQWMVLLPRQGGLGNKDRRGEEEGEKGRGEEEWRWGIWGDGSLVVCLLNTGFIDARVIIYEQYLHVSIPCLCNMILTDNKNI